MSTQAGYAGDVYIATGTGTAMTTEATTSVSATVYQITNTAKRTVDPSTAITVYDNGVAQDPSKFEMHYASGQIFFNYTPTGPVTITGAYLTLSQCGQCFEWSLTAGPNLVDATTFGSSWEVKAGVLKKGAVQVKRFYLDAYFLTNIGNFFALNLYLNQSAGTRFMVIAKLDSSQMTENNGQLVGQDLSFTSHGPVDYSLT